jgi:ketosteroid isomerase-like protein
MAVNGDLATQLLSRLHKAQNTFYAGGGEGELRNVLSPNIAWHVPGRNRIAGTYRGHEQVLAYFTRRRDQAANTFHIARRDVLVGAGDMVAAICDGSATIGDRVHTWTAIGLYTILDDRIARCWLLPTDSDTFDRIWSI